VIKVDKNGGQENVLKSKVEEKWDNPCCNWWKMQRMI
jgi:hypothetical protein